MGWCIRRKGHEWGEIMCCVGCCVDIIDYVLIVLNVLIVLC